MLKILKLYILRFYTSLNRVRVFYMQGCTNPGKRVGLATKFDTVLRNIWILTTERPQCLNSIA